MNQDPQNASSKQPNLLRINLANPPQSLKKTRLSNSYSPFFLVSIIVFILIFLGAFSILVYVFTLKNNLSNAQFQENQLNDHLQEIAPELVNALFLKDRLSNINKITTFRTRLDVQISSLLAVLPQDVIVSAIIGDSKSLKLSVISDNLNSLNTLIEERIKKFASNNNLKIKRIDSNGLTLDQARSLYVLTFLIQF